MSRYLLLVESPTKARRIHAMLTQSDPSNEWVVLASYGHLVDLPRDTLGVDVKNGFDAQFTLKDRKKYNTILKQVELSDAVYLGTDDDREGEGIAYHLNKLFLDTFPAKQIKRVRFHEITQQAVTEAINDPGDINLNAVECYLTRRILDRVIGYTISPVLWSWVGRKLSAGRVQSCVLKLLVDLELERSKFVPQQQWFVRTSLVDGTRMSTQPLANEKLANSIQTALKKQKLTANVTEKVSVSKSFPPFTTASMIRSAAAVMHWASDQTMWMAQALYEDGLITYHRTDSVGMNLSFINASRTYITTVMGDKYLNEQPRWTLNTAKAHEAIRPTSLNRLPQTIRVDAQPLYRLIWRQAVASQAADAQFLDQEAKANVMVDGFGIKLTGHGRKITFDGHYRVRGQVQNAKAITSTAFSGESVVEAEYTKPPDRFTEDVLIGKLEDLKIGRPSTYASIVKGLVENYYIRRTKTNLHATQKGILIGKWLSERFTDLTESTFTAEMESKLDSVSSDTADTTRLSVLKSYWDWLEPKLSLDKAWILCYSPCPHCGSELEVVIQQYGEPILFCNDKRKGVAHGIEGLPPANIGCGKYISLDLGPSAEPIIFNPYDVPGLCPHCKVDGKMKMLGGKHGPYIRCTGCNQVVQKE